ncbi:MAG: hypothetical protein WCA82_06695, partial [Jiangellales bacterium]
VVLVFTADLLLNEWAGVSVPLSAAVFTGAMYVLWRAVWLLYSGRRASTALERAALPHALGGKGFVAVLTCSFLLVLGWQSFLWEFFSLTSSRHLGWATLVGLMLGAALYLSARWMGARAAASERYPDVQPVDNSSSPASEPT